MPNIIKTYVNLILEMKKKESAKFVEEAFHRYTRHYLGKWIFGDESNTIPILEKSTLGFRLDNGKWIQVPRPDVSSAEVLGLALSNTYFRFSGISEYESLSANSQSALALVFQAICKMASMMGYLGYDSKLIESLAVPMVPGHRNERLDIRSYKSREVPFAIPDKVFIKERFKSAAQSEVSATANVEGQMELLRGYVKMMKFLKPWSPSIFDEGMGNLRIEEDKTIEVFSKKDFFLLSYGLASMLALNIRDQMVALVTSTDKIIRGVELEEILRGEMPMSTGAVITGLSVDHTSTVVTTQGLAKAMIAISEYYEVTGDLEKSDNEAILNSLPIVNEARPLAKKVLAGMAIFASSHLMDTDGGFRESFDFKTGQASKKVRILDTQLLMSEALMTVGNLLNSDLIRFRAVDNYYFLNNFFWNPHLGFYNSVENDAHGRVRIVNVARALKNSYGIEKILKKEMMTHGSNSSFSHAQVILLRDLWTKRFFSDETVHMVPLTQVLEFSL